MDITIEDIQKKFDSLPEEIKWAISKADVDENIIEIGKAYSLNVEQQGQLSLLTHMVMMGFIHPEIFEESVEKTLKLPAEKNKQIVTTVNEKILKEIRTLLMAQTILGEEDGIPLAEPVPEEKPIVINTPSSQSEQENKKIIDSVASQRLMGSFQTSIKKTDYNLNPQNKTTPPTPSAPSTPSVPSAPSAPESKPKVDPYREIPE
ncbi:MAG TPA: hypothetical protein VFQ59_01125 [Candidatus Paceibacterota bacterium]|nr:hypothetical protein [Candidatus Paceibacterota bacterium]